MKHLKLASLVLGLLFIGCNQAENKTASITEENLISSSDDKKEIQNVIRQVLNWSNTKGSIDILPVLTDKDSICIGFDLKEHKNNLDKLEKTTLFAEEFIDNYNQIILTLDKKIKNKELEKWNTYELPTFNFVNDVDPWCLCQDVPYDEPKPWGLIEISNLKLDGNKANAEWKWGKLEPNSDQSWKDFSYNFRAVKENGKWRISYLQGFDFNESTR